MTLDRQETVSHSFTLLDVAVMYILKAETININFHQQSVRIQAFLIVASYKDTQS